METGVHELFFKSQWSFDPRKKQQRGEESGVQFVKFSSIETPVSFYFFPLSAIRKLSCITEFC